VGGSAFFITCICALAAYVAPETYRLAMEDLGSPDAKPIDDAYGALCKDRLKPAATH